MTTTREFMEKTYNTTSTKERSCSSVFTDMYGTVYSYGYHYPLAFHVKGLDFINTRGYSNTTARHILWAWQAVGYHAIAVELDREDARVIASGGYDEGEKALIIKRALYRQLKSLMDEMESKKRKDTAVYRDLQAQHERVYNDIQRVEAA